MDTSKGTLWAYGDRGGRTFDRTLDAKRLGDQHLRVLRLMYDGVWRTLAEIGAATGDPEASVSARLRDFRKSQWGGYTVERRRRGEGKRGLHEYRLVVEAGQPAHEA